MITEPQVGALEGAVLEAVAHEGLTAKTPDGRAARLAIIDDNGNVIAIGDKVAEEAWNVAIASYRNFLRGKGWLRVHTKPPGASA